MFCNLFGLPVASEAMLRPRGRQPSTGLQDWSNRGSFMNKPTRGWLHPDSQLNPDAGVIYGVRVSMKISLHTEHCHNAQLLLCYFRRPVVYLDFARLADHDGELQHSVKNRPTLICL